MTIGDSLESALRAIMANKLRSALTMLGVVIGIGSVIAMIGIGAGTKQKALENLEAMGTNMLMVMDWRRNADPATRLTLDDVERLRAQVPTIQAITGAVMERGITVTYGGRNHRTSVIGAEPVIARIRNAEKMHSGAWYTYEDEERQERKAVIGYLVYDELFQGEDAIGATIRIRGQNYEVVGVIDYKGASNPWNNPDDQIYIPLETGMKRLMGTDRLSSIFIQANDVEFMPLTQAMVEETLRQTRRSATGEDLFRVFNQGEQIAALEEQNRLLSSLLAGIASVSLLVGGIGIMNIMLVSVTERTREIGLRKAIGARKESILTQFLLESVVMCFIGGIFGVLLGRIATLYVAGLLNVPPVFNLQAVGAAVVFSALVGIFFGLYPAIRASRLQPIEALRYE